MINRDEQKMVAALTSADLAQVAMAYFYSDQQRQSPHLSAHNQLPRVIKFCSDSWHCSLLQTDQARAALHARVSNSSIIFTA